MNNQNPKRIIRLHEVIKKTGLSRSNIYLQMDEGRFPQSISIGSRSVGWLESSVDEWIDQKLAQRQE